MAVTLPDHIEDAYPLSPLQQGMLFHSLLHEDSGVYLMQDRYTIKGPLEEHLFLQAWKQVVDLHPSLRASFQWKSQKKPLQVIHRTVDVPLDILDLRHLPGEEQQATLHALLEDEQRRGLNLSRPPLIRFRLVRLADGLYEFIRSFHHILMDAWCISLVTVDFLKIYTALCRGETPQVERPRPYRDYIHWLKAQDPAQAERFWRDQLAGLSAPTPLVVERSSGGQRYTEAVLVDDELIRLEAEDTQLLMAYCRSRGLTPNTFFQGAWALLLARYSGQSDVVFGVTVAGRPPELAGVEAMIGLFINTLPLRISLDEKQLLEPWLLGLQARNAAMRDFEHTPLTDIQGWSDFPRGEALFDSILVYENAPIDDCILSGESMFRLEDMEHSVHTHYGLTVVILPGERLGVRISYDRRRFEQASVMRLLQHVQQLVRSMLAHPQSRLRDLRLLTADEEYTLLHDWSANAQDFALDRSYAALFAAQVAAQPQAIAAVCQGKSLSYAELDQRASQLAHALIETGAGPETLVALLAPRGLELLAMMLAVFKAGAAMLPLEVKHPPERLQQILQLSGSRLWLGDQASLLRLGLQDGELAGSARILVSDHVAQAALAPEPLAPRGAPDQLAYVLFTSGSTGTPKGVMIEQRGMLNNIFGKVPGLGLSAQDRLAQTASVAFDISVWQFLAAPVLGATVHILPDEIAHDPQALAEAVEREQLSILEVVPSLLQAMVSDCDPDIRFASLRWVMPTGEALPPATAQAWFSRFPQVPLMNAYGPAECADDVAFSALHEAPAADCLHMPIGRPTANNRLFVLDEALRPQPIGVAGEICVGGTGVGRGYLHDPGRTAEAFLSSPFHPGERLYRTGDIGRWRSDGQLEYLGRRDQQVKLRGHRIELSEIEHRLGQQPGVRATAVLLQKDARDQACLLAYFSADRALDAAQLARELGRKLPAYMVPAHFIQLDELPKNANGKIDRKALAARRIEWQGAHDELISPRTAMEHSVAAVWAEVLGLQAFSVESNFFSLGGHSLLATQVIARLRQRLKIELPLKTLFEQPTVAGLALRIEALQQQGSSKTARLPALQAQARPQRLPLSFAQQRLWFIEQLEPESTRFNVPYALEINGQLQLDALRAAFQSLIDRHEVLRTGFDSEAGEPWQRIDRKAAFELPVEDLTHLPADMAALTAQERLQELFATPFDLRHPPLLRARVLLLDKAHCLLGICLHHLVSDAWSATIALRELTQAYAAHVQGQAPAWEPLTVHYADFALWQRQILQGKTLEDQLSYWKGKLKQDQGDYLLSLPTDHARPAVQSYRAGSCTLRLSHELSAQVRRFAADYTLTPFITVLASFAALAQRLSGQSQILLGTPVSQREQRATETMLGIMLNTLVLRADFSNSPSFAQLGRQLAQDMLDAQQHQDLPFEQLVDALQLPRSLSHAPLFQLMVAQQLSSEQDLRWPGLTLREQPVSLSHLECDLDLHVSCPAEGAIELQLLYALDLYLPQTAERTLQRLACFLERLLNVADTPIAQLPLLLDTEWQQIVVDWNDTAAAFPRETTLVELFEQQVARTPQAIAVVCDGLSLSYGELNVQANQLAHYLRSCGVGADTPVALCVDRSLSMFAGLFAILKAGGAYVPLDPSYPPERLAHMLDDAQPRVLITQSALLDRLPETRPTTLCLDRDASLWQAGDASNPPCLHGPQNLAYIIYTSGSTGKPKGTLIYHRAVVNLAWARIHGLYRRFIQGPMRASFNYSFSFDASVAELILLLDGHTLYVTPDDARYDMAALSEFFRQHRLHCFECTPAQLKPMIESGDIEVLPDMVLFGGDAIDAQLWQTLQSISRTQFFNTYGPTECTVDATGCHIQSAPGRPVIGRPIANTRTYILDAQLNPLPAGVAGELHIAGEGVSYGYLHRAELNAERFIRDPFVADAAAKMYKSGDLCRYLADGTIEYLGRIDNQVKIRGFRIELGEIEATLGRYTGIEQAVVVARQDQGDKQLVAYLVGQEVDLPHLRAWLEATLPSYMVPAHFVMLDRLPLTANGKIDRKALPAPERQRDAVGAAFVAPRTACEQAIARIWAEVLRVDAVGVFDNFFALGGHSLLTTQVLARLRQQLGVAISLRDFFTAPTVAQLAALAAGLPGSGLAAIPRAQRGAALLASHAQQRLWFLDQYEAGSGLYNLPEVWRLDGVLDVAALDAALQQLVARHEALRTRFVVVDGQPMQMISTACTVSLRQTDLRGQAQVEATSRALMLQEAHDAFDLENGPLLRTHLLRLADEQHLLLFTAHHIAVDGSSIDILLRDLGQLYAAARRGLSGALPALRVQYADFAVWQRQHAGSEGWQSSLDYWKAALAGAPERVQLPSDPMRPSRPSQAGALFSFAISAALQQQLEGFCRQQQVTLFAVLAAALTAVLSRYSGQDDICIGYPADQRKQPELENVVGLFINTLVLRNRLQAEQSFADLVRQTAEAVMMADAHQDLPFEQLLDALGLERSLSHTPLFQVMLALHRAADSQLAWPDLALTPLVGEQRLAKYELTLSVVEQSGCLHAAFEYQSDLFAPDTIERLAGHYLNLLADGLQQPQQAVSRLRLLGDAERQALLHAPSVPSGHAPEVCLHRRVEQHALQTPEAVALSCAGQVLSYAELNQRANRLAHRLQSLGVQPDSLVAVCLPRSLDMAVALLAVLKAGGAYLPLDPDYPSARLTWLLDDSEASHVLSRSDISLPSTSAQRLDIDCPTLAAEASHDPQSTVGADHLAYCIYTSGSTGQPKGVLIEHRQVARLFTATQAWFAFGSNDVWTVFHSFAFDFSVWELWGALCHGGRAVIVPAAVSRAPQEFLQLLQDEQVSVLNQTPSAFKALMHQLDSDYALPAQPSLALRLVIFGGEALDFASLRPWYRRFADDAPQLVNMYGITETTVHVSYRPLRAEDTQLRASLIGVPIPDLQMHVLDGQGEPCPIGVPGELCIAGAGLARGYLKRPQLTAERFVSSPLAQPPGSRLYRSGDLARRLADGSVEYLGRMDQQVKIRGFRIELGEIEQALQQHDAVRQAVVLARGDQGRDMQLVAYVVAREQSLDQTALITALEGHLARSLPAHMLPAAWVLLPAMPLTANGKLDRKSLPAPGPRDADGAVEPPCGAIETRLAALWAQVLQLPLEHLGRDSHFFRLGGHSLSAATLFARLRHCFAEVPPLRTLFEQPLLKDLASMLQGLRSEGQPTLLPRPARLPLSFSQERLCVLERLDQGRGTYNIGSAILLRGTLQVDVLAQALQGIADRHEILRSRVCEDAHGLYLHIHEQDALQLETLDCALHGDAWLNFARECAETECKRPFDLQTQAPMRARLIVNAQQAEAVLLLTLHHSVADDGSMQCLADELGERYRAGLEGRSPRLPELPLQYVDHAVQQRAADSSSRAQALAGHLDYWRRTLENGDYVLDLPCDRPRPAVADSAAGTLHIQLPLALQRRVRQFAQEQNLTVFMLLLAAAQLVLGRYANQRDVRFGTPVAQRQQPELQALIGCFINTVVVRGELDPELTFAAYLQQSKQSLLDALQHQDLPFERLIDDLAPQRNLANTPLFQVLFVQQTARLRTAGTQAWPGLELSELDTGATAAKFDLNWEVHDAGDSLSLRLEYRRALFDQATVQRWVDDWQAVLCLMADEPGRHLRDYSPLRDDERHLQLEQWNASDTLYPGPQTLSDALRQQLLRTPEAEALCFGDRRLSYRALHEQANHLAHALRAAGAGPESVVAVCMERSLELVIALLAIVKAGAAYLPLDQELPQARLDFMLHDAQPRLLLVQAGDERSWPASVPVWTYGQLPAGQEVSSAEPQPVNTASDLVYLLYTSGSTGQPKGVLTEHGALMNRLYWMQEQFPLDGHDRVLQKTPYGFDVSVWEFFWPLISGATLVLAQPGAHRDSAYLAGLIRHERISTVHFVPSMLRAFVQEPGLEHCRSLRQVFASGEALPADLVRRFYSRSEAQLVNLYGPTEAAIDVSCWRCDPEALTHSVPIGRPIANLRLYILDESLQPLPIGTPGELYIGGAGVARAYLNRPQLTAERFIASPFVAGERLYRTGDRARYRADGQIDYLGRLDHQVKLRGQRIELGEIEAALLQQAGVRDAAAMVRDEQGSQRLVAYVVRDACLQPAAEVLLAALAQTLPAYMLPQHVVFLDAMPLSINGKLDRKALPKPQSDSESQVAARAPAEIALCETLQSLLNVAHIGVQANFFALGGDSILGLQWIARLRERGFALTPHDLFRQRTLGELAIVAQPLQASDAEQGLLSGELPLLPIQHWFFDRQLSQMQHWQQATLIALPRELTLSAVHAGLQRLCEQHDALRLCFGPADSGEGAWRQYYRSEGHSFHLRALTVADFEQLPQALADLSAHYQLADGPLLVGALLQAADGRQALYLAAHHLLVDMVSWTVLLDDLRRLLTATSSRLPAKTHSYRQWVQALQAYARLPRVQEQRSYWLQQDVAMQLPGLQTAQANRAGDEVTLLAELDEEASRFWLGAANQVYSTQPQELLLAALTCTLARWTECDSVRIDMEGHGRDAPLGPLDVSRTVGWFTTLYPLRLQLAEDHGLGATLMAVKDTLRSVPDKGAGYGALRYYGGEAWPLRHATAVLFNFLGQIELAGGAHQSESAPFSVLDHKLPASSAADNARLSELEIVCSVTGGRLLVEWRFSPLRLDHAAQQALLGGFIGDLRAVLDHCRAQDARTATPSDFPLARGLNQKSLNALLARLNSDDETLSD